MTSQTLPCRVYQELSREKALGAAFSRNRDAEDVLDMSDYERVMTIRKVISEGDYDHQSIYNILRVTDVSKTLLISMCNSGKIYSK